MYFTLIMALWLITQIEGSQWSLSLSEALPDTEKLLHTTGKTGFPPPECQKPPKTRQKPARERETRKICIWQKNVSNEIDGWFNGVQNANAKEQNKTRKHAKKAAKKKTAKNAAENQISPKRKTNRVSSCRTRCHPTKLPGLDLCCVSLSALSVCLSALPLYWVFVACNVWWQLLRVPHASPAAWHTFALARSHLQLPQLSDSGASDYIPYKDLYIYVYLWLASCILCGIKSQSQPIFLGKHSPHTLAPNWPNNFPVFFFILSAVLRVRARALSLILVCGVGFIYFYKRTNTHTLTQTVS